MAIGGRQSQFDLLMIAITGLDAKIGGVDAKVDGVKKDVSDLRTEMRQEFANVRAEAKQEFARVNRSIEILTDQVGKTVSDVDALKGKRMPSA